MKTNVLFVGIPMIFAALLSSGCIKARIDVADAKNDAYPRFWSEQGMPKIPEATFVSSKFNVRRLNDAIRFELLVNQSVADVAGYYEKAFEAKGWDFSRRASTSRASYQNEFSDGKICVTIQAKQDVFNSTQSKVQIAFRTSPDGRNAAVASYQKN